MTRNFISAEPADAGAEAQRTQRRKKFQNVRGIEGDFCL
jgi:hypothetical protein